jgi:hypothetical protein
VRAADARKPERKNPPKRATALRVGYHRRTQTARGWAIIAEDGIVNGRFYFHCGDASDFLATRVRRDRELKPDHLRFRRCASFFSLRRRFFLLSSSLSLEDAVSPEEEDMTHTTTP